MNILKEIIDPCFAFDIIELTDIQIYLESLTIINDYCQNYLFSKIIIGDLVFYDDEELVMNRLADILCETQCVHELIIKTNSISGFYIEFYKKILQSNFIENVTFDSNHNTLLILLSEELFSNSIKNINLYVEYDKQLNLIILANDKIKNIFINFDIDQCDFYDNHCICQFDVKFINDLFIQISNGRVIHRVTIRLCKKAVQSGSREMDTIKKFITLLLRKNILIELHIDIPCFDINYKEILYNYSLSSCNINGNAWLKNCGKNIVYKNLALNFLLMIKATSYKSNRKIGLNDKIFMNDICILPKYIIRKILDMMDKNDIR